ncbi:MAG TPA: OmpA family protein [Patescibacteria group bacterium]|nr:OmpA family protein [Patescibacteria group bacterium]
MRKFLFILTIPVLLASCVSASKYEELEASHTNLQRRYDSLDVYSQSLLKQIENLDYSISGFISDTSSLNETLRSRNEQLKSLQDELIDARAEMDALSAGLQQLKLRTNRETRLLIDSLQTLQRDISQREQRINEIQQKLNARDSVVNALRTTINNALLGFKAGDLSVTMRDGKVYVSLSNQLLFATGSTRMDEKGKQALLQLAQVLNREPDINVVVEGHTDNAPVVNLGAIKDNWDLSVMCSTEVIRYLVNDGKVNPQRITASGRSEYFPVVAGSTPEVRAQNRRTEIILTPKLDVLYDVLGK